MEWLLESCLEKFPHGPLLKDEKKEVVHHLKSKDVAILSTGFEESLTYQLYTLAKEKQMERKLLSCNQLKKGFTTQILFIPLIINGINNIHRQISHTLLKIFIKMGGIVYL